MPQIGWLAYYAIQTITSREVISKPTISPRDGDFFLHVCCAVRPTGNQKQEVWRSNDGGAWPEISPRVVLGLDAHVHRSSSPRLTTDTNQWHTLHRFNYLTFQEREESSFFCGKPCYQNANAEKSVANAPKWTRVLASVSRPSSFGAQNRRFQALRSHSEQDPQARRT